MEYNLRGKVRESDVLLNSEIENTESGREGVGNVTTKGVEIAVYCEGLDSRFAVEEKLKMEMEKLGNMTKEDLKELQIGQNIKFNEDIIDFEQPNLTEDFSNLDNSLN